MDSTVKDKVLPILSHMGKIESFLINKANNQNLKNSKNCKKNYCFESCILISYRSQTFNAKNNIKISLFKLTK